MTIQTELQSWLPPSPTAPLQPLPTLGAKAPSTSKLDFTAPSRSGRPTVVTFLRHCGCPFAEKTLQTLRSTATTHPEVHFIAISQSTATSTKTWLTSLDLPDLANAEVIVDPELEIFSAWGLGASSFWHVLNPASLWNVVRLGREEGIWNRPTESGSRWQMGGGFAVDKGGVVRWVRPAGRADEVLDFGEGVKAVEGRRERE